MTTCPVPQRLNRIGELFTIEAAAQELRMSFWTIDRLIRLRGIQTYIVGNARLVRLTDLTAHIAR